MYDTYNQTLQDQIGQLSKLLGAQSAPTTASPQATSSYDCVDGVEGARSFLGKMLASTKHIVWDSQQPIFYVLSKDANGTPARIQICKFEVELEPTMEEKYVTREDFNALSKKLDQLLKKGEKANG